MSKSDFELNLEPRSEMFRGNGAVFALLLAWVKHDLWYAPEDSPAHKSAKAFAEGVSCQHIECPKCQGDCDDKIWSVVMGTQCTQCGCGHTLDGHVVAEYDWKEWRNRVCQSLGLDPEVFAQMLRKR